MLYFLTFILALILCFFITKIIIKIAYYFKILDYPQVAPERKIHQKPKPLLGGLAIFSSFFIILFLVWKFNFLPLEGILSKHLIGLFIAGLILMIGGVIDDKWRIKPYQQIIFPILASLVIIISGIGIKFINNPFHFFFPQTSAYLYFDQWKIEIIRIKGIPYYFTPLADIFTFIWLMVLAYSTKILDGLDGLVSGISVISGLVIFALAYFTQFYQPDIALISSIFAGAWLGFLFLNFYPAKIFLGEGGSLWAGFMIGSLAILSGGKLATAFLLLGIPVFDVIWVILRRVLSEKRTPFLADKKHLHHRLLNLGLSQPQAVIFLWSLVLFFGIISLFFKTLGKLVLLGTLLILMFILALILKSKEKLTSG